MNDTQRLMFRHLLRDFTDKLGNSQLIDIASARNAVEHGDMTRAREFLGRAERNLNAAAGAVQAVRHVVEFGPEHYDLFKEMGIIPKDLQDEQEAKKEDV